MSGRTEWVPLVRAVGEGYALSHELLNVAGPLWGRSWELQAFVAHLISHFDDPLEHLLDYDPTGHEDAFDVDPEWCELIAHKYKESFLDLPAQWYRSMFRAKLESLRLPTELVEQARWAYLQRNHDHGLVIAGFLRLAHSEQARIPDALMVSIQSLPDLPMVEAWAGLERALSELLHAGVITGFDIDALLGDPEGL